MGWGGGIIAMAADHLFSRNGNIGALFSAVLSVFLF